MTTSEAINVVSGWLCFCIIPVALLLISISKGRRKTLEKSIAKTIENGYSVTSTGVTVYGSSQLLPEYVILDLNKLKDIDRVIKSEDAVTIFMQSVSDRKNK